MEETLGLDESLGSGFDNIRAALMSPTSFSAQIDLSPVSVRAVTSLRRPSFSSLAGVGGPFNSPSLGMFYGPNNILGQNGPVSVYSTESSLRDHSPASSEGTYIDSHDARFSESPTGSELSTTALTDFAQESASLMEGDKDITSELHANARYDVVEQGLSPQYGSDGYESDPDDTRKFYTELQSYIAVGDDGYDTDDSDYFDTDSDYEPSSTGQMLTSISRYDHRFHRYWHAEQSDLAENHFDTPLQTSRLIFGINIVMTLLMALKRKSGILQLKNLSNAGYMRRSPIARIFHLDFQVRHWKPRMSLSG